MTFLTLLPVLAHQFDYHPICFCNSSSRTPSSPYPYPAKLRQTSCSFDRSISPVRRVCFPSIILHRFRRSMTIKIWSTITMLHRESNVRLHFVHAESRSRTHYWTSLPFLRSRTQTATRTAPAAQRCVALRSRPLPYQIFALTVQAFGAPESPQSALCDMTAQVGF